MINSGENKCSSCNYCREKNVAGFHPAIQSRVF